MAVRARRYQEAKAQAGTNLELAWWVFMRVSGLVLVFLVLGHLYMSNILINAGKVEYTYIAERLSNTTWKIYDWAMLSLSLLHGMNGLRYVMDRPPLLGQGGRLLPGGADVLRGQHVAAEP